ncbi:MAG TPA: DUF6600 domain-containing protein [Bryobacteraceae bacterium]|nr:DUF6600 domain-containing protein [Bryobacteraceae bacterium]
MRQHHRIFLLAAATVILAAAQDDPPGRVGRLSYMNGDVSFRSGDVEDWSLADINRPLTTGDHLWTDDGARAELHIGSAALRLNSKTAFEFLNLDDSNVQIRLAEGSLSIHLRDLGNQESYEIDTPNVAFSLLRPGDYRIDVNPDSQTTLITVRAGQGEATGGGQAFTLHPREQAEISGTDTIAFNVTGAPQADEWDGWCLARDRREDRSPSAQYVSRDMTGYQDLDDNGTWRQVPDYGSVWVPNAVASGWAPYHNGHWSWVEPWGWTWVDDAPWGFAPFHYGRWAYVGYWAWVPGPIAQRPVYAPALVAWVGGSNFNLSVSFGGGAGVAWFPLGPREVYVPAYHASPTYINRVNVTNTTIVNNVNITNVYVNKTYINRTAPGAVTAVPQSAFASARPVQSVAVRVDARAVQSAQVMNTAAVAPSRQSVMGRPAPSGRVAQPPAAVQNRAVVVKTAPPPPAVPFAQRQQALSANPGRPLDPSQVQKLRTAQPAPQRPLVRQAPPAPVNAGRPASSPPNQVAPRQAAPAPGGQRPPQQQNDTATPRPLDRPAEPARPQPQRDVQPPVRPNDRPSEPLRPQPQPQPQQQQVRPQPSPQQQPIPARPEQREVQPPSRAPQRDVAPPRSNDRPAEAPRPSQRDVQPPPRSNDRPAEVPRPPQRDVQPPPRSNDRPAVVPRPQQRDVQPPPRPAERPAPREAPRDTKPPKKDDKKNDKKDDKKQ